MNQIISLRINKETFIKLEILRLKKQLMSGEIIMDEAYAYALNKWEKKCQSTDKNFIKDTDR